MDNVLFLDMDGVVATVRAKITQEHLGHPDRLIDKVALALVDDICRRGNAQIVVSSVWRNRYDRQSFSRLLVRNGSTSQLHTDWCTKNLQTRRGDEVKEWLSRHTINKYVILDDDSDFDWNMPLVQTDPYNGLGFFEYLRALKLLGTDWEKSK